MSSELDAEGSLPKTITIAVLTCFLILGVAASAILARDSVPAATAAMVDDVAPKAVVANRAAKTGRLDRPSIAAASSEPAKSATAVAAPDPVPAPVDGSAALRQAYAAASAADIPLPKAIQPEAPAPAAAAPVAPAKPKVAARPQPQKPYALLSDGQIAGIKERLKLSSSQEYYWPAVESALRKIARRIQANRLSNPHAAGAPIEADAEEIQQLKSAAMPLLFQLREDQKEEVRKLARLIGLERVAQQI